MANLINNGIFDMNLSGQQTKPLNALKNTNAPPSGGWILHGNESPHSVLYMAAANTVVPKPLPNELASESRLGVAYLNNGNSALIYQEIPMNSLPNKGTVVATWWAATPYNANCNKADGYEHSIQFSTAVDNGANVEDGSLKSQAAIQPNTTWKPLSQDFKIDHPEKQHYLSFKGDKNGGLCGVLITGVTLAYKITGARTLISLDSDKTIPAGGTSKQLVFTVTDENKMPLNNVLVDFSLGDDAQALGVQFAGQNRAYREYATAGKLALQAGVIVAGRVGDFTLEASVQGTKFPFTLKVVPDVTDAEFTLVRVESPQPVAINHKFDGPIRVIVHQLVNGANQAAKDGTLVTMSIVDEHSANTPSFKDGPQGESQREITALTKNGSAHSIDLYAGNAPGRYTVKVALQDHPARFLNYLIEVSGIDTFEPPHIAGGAVTYNRILEEGHWRFTAKWKVQSAQNQPVVFDLIDEDETGTHFVDTTHENVTVQTGQDGVVAVPQLKIGGKTGNVTIIASGPGGEPTATVILHVERAPDPAKIEFFESPLVLTAGAAEPIVGGRFMVHVTDTLENDVTNGYVTFSILNDTVHNPGAVFIVNKTEKEITDEQRPISEEGRAYPHDIRFKQSGKMKLTAVVEGFGTVTKTLDVTLA